MKFKRTQVLQYSDKEMEVIKQNQAEVLQLKSTLSEIKNTIGGIRNTIDQTEEGTSELKDRIFENTQQKGKKGKKKLRGTKKA